MQAGLGASTAHISVAGVQNTRSLSNVPKGFAAIWNLNPDYSEDDLRRDLADIVFAPDTLKSLDEVKGAFGLCWVLQTSLPRWMQGERGRPGQRLVRGGLHAHQRGRA